MFLKPLLFLEGLFEKLPKRPRGPVVVENYEGYTNGKRVVLRGRVLHEKQAWEFKKDDHGWRNLQGMVRYWMTSEVEGVALEGEVQGEKFEAVSDEEGYYRVDLTVEGLTVTGADLPYEIWARGEGERFEGVVQTADPKAERFIVSDIDDTVIETGASQLWQMIKTTLLKNYHTRSVFEGVGSLYEALLEGGKNPLYYVTSSPWNLRPMVRGIFELRGVPTAPAFMTDWGFDQDKILKDGHGTHKIGAIRDLLEFHPELRCILIGDSGEKDPEIYHELAQTYGERIEAIYIRHVTDEVRAASVNELADESFKVGVPFTLVQSSQEILRDATERGFISASLQSAQAS